MRKLFYLVLLILATFQLKAQVSDISLNLTPTANYTWWDSNMFIKDAPMVGGMLGIGLGKNLELRGIYEQSVNSKSKLGSFNVDNLLGEFNAIDVDVTRWGGEFKIDVPTKTFLSPFLTLGTGVQKLKFNDIKDEQIYLTAGLGAKYSISDRVSLNLGAKLHAFNYNPTTLLMESGITDELLTFEDKRMMNWSANLGVQFYLSGQNPRKYTDLRKALDKQKNRGLSGLRLVIEPGLAYINFDNSTNMRDTYLLGAAIGVDFNDYVGLRGFYYQSSVDEKVSFDFDKMAMYGADFIGKLNVSRGIVPFLTVGGGYMNVYGSYVGVDENPFVQTNSGYFAKAGLGLSVPITHYVELFGAANILYTTDKDPEDLGSTEDLKKHTMFNAGLKFNIGKKVQDNKALDSYIDKRMSDKVMMYEQRISELKGELDKAYETNDAVKAAEIMSEKQRLESELDVAKDESRVQPVAPQKPATFVAANDTTINQSTTARTEDQTMIRLTPQELESLVDKVVEGVGAPVLKKETPEERLDRLERIIMSGGAARRGQQPTTFSQPQEDSQTEPAVAQAQAELAETKAELAAVKRQEESTSSRIDASNKELLSEIRRISERIEDNAKRIDNVNRQRLLGSDRTVIVTPGGGGNQSPFTNAPQRLSANVAGGGSQSGMYQEDPSQGRATSWVIYKGLSPFLGVNMGDKSSFIFGVKGNYGFSSSKFLFVPDLYFGVGSKVAYGFNANVTYPLLATNRTIFTPYVGVGLGVNKAEKFKFGVNIIGGTYLNIGNGSLFVEYTSRQFFDNNVVSLGYKFNF